MTVYSLLLLAVLVVGSPYWLFRMVTSGRYRAGLRQRLGGVPAALRALVGDGRPVVWVHAVSVGEVMAATEMIRELERELPEIRVVVSTTTDTGQRLAKERLGDDAVLYLPLDFKYAVRRYLRVLRPKLLVLMESELWPRLVMEAAADGVPVAVANARISDRSYPRYLRLRGLWRGTLKRISTILAQSEESAERWRAIGAERVVVTGNLKYDVRASAGSGVAERLRERLDPGRWWWCAGARLRARKRRCWRRGRRCCGRSRGR